MLKIGSFALALLLGSTLAASAGHPKCSADFAASWKKWTWGPQAHQGEMPQPKQPCLLKTKTGNYVCDKDGCGRTNER